jgi:glycerate 2-kinase
MRILVAPDKFKGTLDARQAADAISVGWRTTRPADEIDVVPMADGGEGTMEALVHAATGRVERVQVSGPRGDPVEAAYGIVDTSSGTWGIVEMARASGLQLLDVGRRDPRLTTTIGTGQLMLAAASAGVSKVLVCIGGSATNDGGSGMAAALGFRFLDADGRDLEPGGEALLALDRIDASTVSPLVAGTAFVAACDVDNPLTGPLGASAVYGPQKGASADDVIVLDRALGHLAAVVGRDLGVDLREDPGAGAAGGLGFGLRAFCGARLRPGFEVVAEAVGLGGRIANADLVITGEGSFDAQSMHGKTPAGVIEACTLARTPVVVVCGRAEIEPPGVVVVSLADRVGVDASLGDARASLIRVIEELATRAEELRGARI